MSDKTRKDIPRSHSEAIVMGDYAQLDGLARNQSSLKSKASAALKALAVLAPFALLSSGSASELLLQLEPVRTDNYWGYPNTHVISVSMYQDEAKRRMTLSAYKFIVNTSTDVENNPGLVVPSVRSADNRSLKKAQRAYLRNGVVGEYGMSVVNLLSFPEFGEFRRSPSPGTHINAVIFDGDGHQFCGNMRVDSGSTSDINESDFHSYAGAHIRDQKMFDWLDDDLDPRSLRGEGGFGRDFGNRSGDHGGFTRLTGFNPQENSGDHKNGRESSDRVTNDLHEPGFKSRNEARITALILCFFGLPVFLGGIYLLNRGNRGLGYLLGSIGFLCLWLVFIGWEDWL